MSGITEMLRNRRSIRKYDGTPIDADTLRQVLEAGITSPTGDNYKTVELLLIQSKETLCELAYIRKAGTRMLETAGAAILVMADSAKTDLWIEDASISMAYMHLAAAALGLGSCWIQIRARADVNGADLEPVLREKFDFPAHMRPLAILSLGNIDARLPPHEDGPDWSKVHEERY